MTCINGLPINLLLSVRLPKVGRKTDFFYLLRGAHINWLMMRDTSQVYISRCFPLNN